MVRSKFVNMRVINNELFWVMLCDACGGSLVLILSVSEPLKAMKRGENQLLVTDEVNWLSLRINQLKFQTSGKLPIV